MEKLIHYPLYIHISTVVQNKKRGQKRDGWTERMRRCPAHWLAFSGETTFHSAIALTQQNGLALKYLPLAHNNKPFILNCFQLNNTYAYLVFDSDRTKAHWEQGIGRTFEEKSCRGNELANKSSCMQPLAGHVCHSARWKTKWLMFPSLQLFPTFSLTKLGVHSVHLLICLTFTHAIHLAEGLVTKNTLLLFKTPQNKLS